MSMSAPSVNNAQSSTLGPARASSATLTRLSFTGNLHMHNVSYSAASVAAGKQCDTGHASKARPRSAAVSGSKSAAGTASAAGAQGGRAALGVRGASRALPRPLDSLQHGNVHARGEQPEGRQAARMPRSKSTGGLKRDASSRSQGAKRQAARDAR